MRAICRPMRLLLLLTLSLPAVAPGAEALPRVALQTRLGEIVVELQPDRAPKTVANFLAYVERGDYDGTIFHRVIDGFVIQGGGFKPDYTRIPQRETVPNESRDGLSNRAGTIAMARTRDPHSATSQFYINLRDNRSLDAGGGADPSGWGYTVFGRVVEGMAAVRQIGALPTGSGGPFRSDVPVEPVVIEKMRRLDAPLPKGRE